VFQFAGYSAAGGVLRVINATTVPLQNTAGSLASIGGPVIAGSSNTYWFYWMGATIIAFSYVFNRVFRQEGESTDTHANHRASVAAAIAIFGFTIAFFTLGLNAYSSGVYVTQTILANGIYPTSYVGDNVVQWAFYVWVDLLAVPGTVTALVILCYMIYSGAERLGGPSKTKIPGYSENIVNYDNAGAQISTSSSARLTKRNIQVQY
jgi:hypothetical protein